MKYATERCYDFPEVVIHNGGCPRYRGGVCHPLPTPTPPYNEDEAAAVESYAMMAGYDLSSPSGVEHALRSAGMKGVKRFQASGDTGSVQPRADA